jgi:galactokinase
VGGSIALFMDRYPTTASGFDVYIFGNVPLGKGVSSSASIELAVLNGLNYLFGAKMPPLDLALMAQQVEHRYLKVKSGLLDQFSSQFGREGEALLIDFQSLKIRHVALSKGFNHCSWVVIDSEVKRELASSKYSERVEECRRAEDELKKKGRQGIRDLRLSELNSLLGDVPENIFRRVRHIVSENERSLRALKALEHDEIEVMGRLLYESHTSLSEDYEVSHPHLDFLVNRSKDIEGVFGGRMMGGGFGGCCIFLVQKRAEEAFSRRLIEDYREFCGLDTEPLIFRFVQGASAFEIA